MRPFGDAEVGAGGTPAIWDGSLTGIQVAKKNQVLFTGALNNRGASLRSLQNGMSNFTGIYAQEQLPASFPLFYYNPPSTHFTYLLLEQPFLFCRTELYARFLSLFHFTFQSALQPRRRKP